MIPRVSIGMPVYNGQRYVAEAINSLRAQTFGDFELIISDNGSEDRTETICHEAAVADRRIRYYRNQSNCGAAWNFNHVAKLAAGDLFKWAACDDLCDPEFLARCVEILDAEPATVLAHTRVNLINAAGESIGVHAPRYNTDAGRPHERLREVISDGMCFAFFGVMRRRALMRTPLLGAYAHADGVLLARLCLQGPFLQSEEFLFSSRRHREQSSGVMRDKYMYATWFDPDNAGRVILPNWKINMEYLKAVSSTKMKLSEKLRCYKVLARECASDRRRLARDLSVAARMTVRRDRHGSIPEGGGQ